MPPSDIEVAIAAVLAGAAIVRRDYGAEHERAGRTPGAVGTRTDLDAEVAIRDVLSRSRPHDALRGEETGDSGPSAASRRWLVDPLCGTVNFAATTPLVAVNVALTESGTVTVAAVADPIAEELFWSDGDRAFVRRQRQVLPAEPSAASRLIEVNCDGPATRAFVGGQVVADRRLRQVFSPRVVSSTLAVAWTAVGRRAAYVSDGLFRHNVHYAAAIAVCERAGCLVTDLAGDALHTGRGLLVSADAATHETVLEIVAPHLAEALRAS